MGKLASQSLPRWTLSWGSLISVQMQKWGQEKGSRPCSVVTVGRAGMETGLGWAQLCPLLSGFSPIQPVIELAPRPQQSREGSPWMGKCGSPGSGQLPRGALQEVGPEERARGS